MTKLEQAARQALEALEKHQSILGLTNNKQDTEAITALREALAEQAEQEPIRFIWNGEGWIEADDYIWKTTDDHERRILYAAPVATNEKKFWMEQIEVECNEAVLAEREACANVCEEMIASVITKPMPLRDIVAAIRARGEK